MALEKWTALLEDNPQIWPNLNPRQKNDPQRLENYEYYPPYPELYS